MTKDEAVEMLITYACCSIDEMSCEECPRCKPPEGEDALNWRCYEWDDNDVIAAVNALKEEK
jgi:hypothetical protein